MLHATYIGSCSATSCVNAGLFEMLPRMKLENWIGRISIVIAEQTMNILNKIIIRYQSENQQIMKTF